VREHRAEVRDDGTSPGQEPTLAIGDGALHLTSPLQPAQPRSGARVVLDSRWRLPLPHGYGIGVHRGREFGIRLTVLAAPTEALAAALPRYSQW
jgi:hypothetical protein